MDFPCVLFNPNLISDLIHIPKMSIYGFINIETKKVFIGYSRNTLPAIYRNLQNRFLRQDLKKLKFIIIETIEDRNNLRVRYQYWVNEYRNMGYELYRDYKAIDYKLRIGVLEDPRVPFNGKLYAKVYLQTKGYRELILGVFKTVEEANQFVQEKYSNGVSTITYAGNGLTKEYFEYINKSYR